MSVRKQWPDELKIHLVEYVPIARWNDQHMVDAEGNTFSVPPDRTSKQVLPMLYGPEGSANEVLQGYREMGQMLAKDRFTLKEAAMTARRSWQLTLNNDIKLNLGRAILMKRLARFENFIRFYSSRRKPMANGLATLIRVMTLERQ